MFAFLAKLLDNVHDFLMNLGWAGKFFQLFQRIVQRECAAFVVGTFHEQAVLVRNRFEQVVRARNRNRGGRFLAKGHLQVDWTGTLGRLGYGELDLAEQFAGCIFTRYVEVFRPGALVARNRLIEGDAWGSFHDEGECLGQFALNSFDELFFGHDFCPLFYKN